MKPFPKILVLALGLLVCLSGIWVFPLHEPDEGRYGEIALRMAQSGDWLTPRLNGIRYFEKPPLFFWLAGVSIRLFGPSEFAVRLPSVLAAFLTLVFTLSLADRLFGPRTARLAVLLLLTAPLFAVFAKLALVDMLLTACITGAVASVFEVAVDGQSPSRNQALGFWAMSGCACLCKGPIGVVLPLLGFVLFAIWTRGWSFLRGLVLNPLGLAAFSLVAGPWFVLMEVQNPGYLPTFLVEQHLGRMFSEEHFQRFRPVWYYVPLLAALLAPWTLFLPDVIIRFAGSLTASRPPLASDASGDVVVMSRRLRSRVLLNCLWIGPLVLFSCAQSKLAYYLLPLFPPLCVLLADVFVSTSDGRVRASPAFPRRFLALALICFLATGALLISDWQAERVRSLLTHALAQPIDQEAVVERVNLIVPTASYFAVALGLVGLACLWSARRGRSKRGVSAEPAIAALIIVVSVLPWIAGRLGPLFSARRVALAVQTDLSAADQVLFFQRHYRTVSFYLQRPGILWNASFDEFGHSPGDEELAGSSLQKRPEALKQLWSGTGRTVAIVSGSEDLRDFRNITGAPDSRVIGRFGRVVILQNRPAASERTD